MNSKYHLFALLLVQALIGPKSAFAQEIDFKPTYESLKQYTTPEWFRDAKFGIWSHWGPQSVPERGDWYARFMYLQGVLDWGEKFDVNESHTKRYGHPSEFGYKDLIPLFTAEKWNPEKLMELYQKAGARYFVSMGQHHDNFDMWNSKLQPWNSVNMGPKRDIVKEWQDAAKKNGMPFGVSFHGEAAWTFFESSRLSDHKGPFQGVPYDGWQTKEDGKGKWWEGYDPRDLYGQPHKPKLPANVKYAEEVVEEGEPPSDAFLDNFIGRVYDVLDQYHPELIYFDSGHFPAGKARGTKLIADFYNMSQKWNKGINQAVVNAKHLTDEEQQMFMLDFENTHSSEVRKLPWQTDIGFDGWFYLEKEKEDYLPTQDVIHTLADIVSKNGNMLLNITQSANGEIHPYAYQFLKEMTQWMAINSEGIHGTRPWIKFGEGPSRIEGEKDIEHESIDYSSKDFRFTTKGNVLYAILMKYPESKKEITITSLSKNEILWFGDIGNVSLLGHKGNLKWKRTANGLVVSLPEKAPCDYAYVIKISSSKKSG
ncbi:alpha-L-fucosidase [Zobellia galactanivorans]|uniref:alpha-L-fucosidase n=1 Tax=Zobellia galactanivorans (strain DSM 12802 / CCUG 47099 / CIP 106680 / NCIMB 13871 / Dsij) TaxID=63186 RepID=UPI001C073675|nr:alpha-L-fucosidase [Zobellia galactanivorans]MBU3028416.1 alpha-L-fucosidase [Zobellia galactanivorans]